MRLRRHPSREDLARWLEGDNESIDAHLATCNRCAGILESLDAETDGAAAPPSPGDPTLTQALALAYQAPAGLPERVEEGVVARLDALAMLGVVADLFRAGFETGGILMRPVDHNDDGPSGQRDRNGK